jgi:serine protease Do
LLRRAAQRTVLTVEETTAAMSRRFRFAMLVAAMLGAGSAARAQEPPAVARMLKSAEGYTVKVRASVNWPIPPETFGTGQGTGFIVDKAKGWIVTNAHVAKRSPAVVDVSFGEGETEWLPAEKVYVDNLVDLAVLKVAPDKLPVTAEAAQLGCDDQVRQGASVVAYGHPMSLAFTATRGIVSSVRTIGYTEFVQLDALINPGNSGGPLLLVDTERVIGVNTSNVPGAPGLGFATPVRHLCPILKLLGESRDPTVPILPVYWLKAGTSETLTVAATFANVPGANALRHGDVVIGVAGDDMSATVPALLSQLRGRTGNVMLTVKRGSEMLDINVPLLGPFPTMQAKALGWSGMMIVARAAADIDYRDEPLLRIEFIKQGDPASRLGLRIFDQLDRVDGQRFTTVEALHAHLRTMSADKRVRFLIRRPVAPQERRLTAEYLQFDLAARDVHLLVAGETPGPGGR